MLCAKVPDKFTRALGAFCLSKNTVAHGPIYVSTAGDGEDARDGVLLLE